MAIFQHLNVPDSIITRGALEGKARKGRLPPVLVSDLLDRLQQPWNIESALMTPRPLLEYF